MKPFISSLWGSKSSNISSRLEGCIESVKGVPGQGKNTFVFFRADDIAVPGARFERLMTLFLNYQVPLSLAVVPAWITPDHWKHLRGTGGEDHSLWCWHQHGWCHRNHEQTGKKQEFGPSRRSSQIRTDILKGRTRLETVLDDNFYPVFTPPWNRCSDDTLVLLKGLGYLAVSRGADGSPMRSKALPDFQVNVDLHTRKETDPERGWDNLFFELKKALENRFCGIVIHHQRMNDLAFVFLEMLLGALKSLEGLSFVNIRDLVMLTNAHP